MDYEKTIRNAFSYAREGKAVLAYEVFCAAWAALAVLVALVLFSRYGNAVRLIAFSRHWFSLPLAFAGLLAAFLVFFIGFVSMNGTVITNTQKKESLFQSWQRFSPRLGSLIGVGVVLALASAGVNAIFKLFATGLPHSGGVFSTLSILYALGLAFLFSFAEYAVVLDGLSASEALKKSAKLALETPAEVFFAIVVSSGLALVTALATLIMVAALAWPLLMLNHFQFNWASGIIIALGLLGITLGFFFGYVIKRYIMADAFVQWSPAAAFSIMAPRETPAPEEKEISLRSSKLAARALLNAAAKTKKTTRPKSKSRKIR